jgi:hypothetical protein
MTSERQKIANRENALRSTGPKTPEGKAAVRFNALRHGALAQSVVIPGENADAFENLRNEVWANYSPVGPIEEFLVTRTAASALGAGGGWPVPFADAWDQSPPLGGAGSFLRIA